MKKIAVYLSDSKHIAYCKQRKEKTDSVSMFAHRTFTTQYTLHSIHTCHTRHTIVYVVLRERRNDVALLSMNLLLLLFTFSSFLSFFIRDFVVAIIALKVIYHLSYAHISPATSVWVVDICFSSTGYDGMAWHGFFFLSFPLYSSMSFSQFVSASSLLLCLLMRHYFWNFHFALACSSSSSRSSTHVNF